MKVAAANSFKYTTKYH